MSADTDPSRSRSHVVVVEGDRAMRRLLKRLLERDGVTVQALADEGDLERHLEQQHALGEAAAVLVADLDRPGGVGPDTLRRLRCAWPGLPILLITAFGDSFTTDRARRIGAVGVLEKPFDLHDLRQLVLRLIRERPDGTEGAGAEGLPDTQGAA